MGLFTDLAVGLGSSLIGGFIEEEGRKDLAESQEEGSRIQAEKEKLGREFQKEQFEKQIERQQPFLDVGERALPAFQEAISNRGDVSDLPATKIQAGMISDFLGDQAPGFIKDRALQDLEAFELEKNKGRLSNLINVGLGGVGAEATSRGNIGTTSGQSLMQTGNIEAQALQQAAADKANRRNRLITGVSGIPAFVNEQIGQEQSFDPFNLINF